MRNDTEDRGRAADSHRVGGAIFRDDEGSTDGNAITQGDVFKNHITSPQTGLLKKSKARVRIKAS